jgi:hypothetical protein
MNAWPSASATIKYDTSLVNWLLVVVLPRTVIDPSTGLQHSVPYRIRGFDPDSIDLFGMLEYGCWVSVITTQLSSTLGHEWAIRATIYQDSVDGSFQHRTYVRDDINGGFWVYDDLYRHSEACHKDELTDDLQGHYMLFLEKIVKS